MSSELALIEAMKAKKMVKLNSKGFGYNIDEGLRKWRTSFIDPLKHVAFVGDSITEGYYAADRLTQGYVEVIRSDLQNRLGNGGEGFIALHKTDRWTLAGTWTTFANTGPFGCCKIAVGTGNTATISNVYCDNIDIFVLESSDSGAFTVSIDGGTPITVGGSAATQSKKYNVSAGSLGNHTIVITAPTANKIYLWGISINVGSTGIRVHNVGKSGALIGDISNGSQWDFLNFIKPQLTVIAMTTNDFNTQTALTTYRNRMETVINKALPYGSVFLIGACEMSTVKTIKQKEYHAVVKSLADQYNCSYLDITERWKDYSTANALGLMYDVAHPNTKGHADQARGILRHMIEIM